MKRFAPLALIVFALALIPAAFADDSTPVPTQPTTTTAPATTTTTTPADTRPKRSQARAVAPASSCGSRSCACGSRSSSSACGPTAARTARLARALCRVRPEGRRSLTKPRWQRQAKIARASKNCTPDSTDPKCKNADKKIAVLTRVDTYLQNVIQKLNAWLGSNSSDSSSSSSSDSALDQAAGRPESAAAGSNS